MQTFKAFRPPLRYRVRWRVRRDRAEWKLAWRIDWRHPVVAHRRVRAMSDEHRRAVERSFFFGN